MITDKNIFKKYNYTIIILNCLSTQKEDMQMMQQEIYKIIESLVYVTDDFSSIQNTISGIPKNYLNAKDDIRVNERHKLYSWLVCNNMVLLGLNKIKAEKLKNNKSLKWQDFTDNKGLFAFNENEKDNQHLSEMQDYLFNFQQSGLSVTFEESKYNSQIYNTKKLIYIFSKEKKGKEEIIFCLICLFNQLSQKMDVMVIPLVSYKLQKIIQEESIYKSSYSYKHLRDFFNKFPKYECFRMELDEIRILLANSRFVWELNKINTVVYYLKKKNYARLVVSIPIPNFNDKDFNKVKAYVAKLTQENISQNYWFKFRNIFQCHFVFILPEKHKNFYNLNLTSLNDNIKNIFEEWNQRLTYEIDRSLSKSDASKNKARYKTVFDNYYQSTHNIAQAIEDINNLNFVLETKKECVNVVAKTKTESIIILYTYKDYPLSNILPELQNLALKTIQEISYQLTIEEQLFHKYTYKVKHKNLNEQQRVIFKNNIQEALLALLNGTLANEKLNGLVTCAGFNYQQANLFTALKKYIYQLKFSIDSNILDNIILSKPDLNCDLAEYFNIKFYPTNIENREAKLIKYKKIILEKIAQLKTLTEDTIFRNLFNFLEAIVRTNYYTKKIDEALALKINCSQVELMLNPKPLYEIFVYGIEMTGIHLRGAKIARGGLRFSDRKNDFRTEVLGLMAAQMLKNAVIVPEGSKGGFIIDEPFSTRAEMFAVVEKHYRRFISALLSVTDNHFKDKIVTPKGIIRYDKDDPYLVVAADKGTAHLSDVANEISINKGFWLGDAFASGGSVGYNHKEVGITAKGAWECVKIHFLELGIDIQNEHFSVVGIGDMGGDVFGNGMLLSKKILLKAAFNHIHIFIDPNPPKDNSAWQERKRLFEKPGTSWLDYNQKLISQGGGVFERNAKSVNLSEQLKTFLQTDKNKVSGEELIRMLLTAQVDLLWNGGIGTYVKSVKQTNLAVGDPNNDSVRVDACDLQTRVIGEGGNLGFTQAARLEYAFNGGKMNADSIDNSAGVNMSDNEVNIKIMIGQLMAAKKVANDKARIKLLADLTDEVTEVCLYNNKHQSYTLSISQLDSKNNLDNYNDFVDFLINEKIIDPEKEEIASHKLVLEKEVGLPRPYLCSLLSYSKLYFFRNILPTFLPDEKFFQQCFVEYFPPSMVKKFDLLKYPHQLYREIITTSIINKNINQFGIPFLYLMSQWSNRSFAKILQAYIIADNIFECDKLRNSIFKIYSGKSLNKAYLKLLELEDFLKEMTLWILLNIKTKDITFNFIDKYKLELKKYTQCFLCKK